MFILVTNKLKYTLHNHIYVYLLLCAIFVIWDHYCNSKPVPILSQSFTLGVFFLLPIRYNKVRGVMKDHMWNTDLILGYLKFFRALTFTLVIL